MDVRELGKVLYGSWGNGTTASACPRHRWKAKNQKRGFRGGSEGRPLPANAAQSAAACERIKGEKPQV